MKKFNDNMIQELLDKKLSAFDTELSSSDEKALKMYQILFEVLEKEPEEGLPFNFSTKVRQKIILDKKPKSDIKFNVLISLMFFMGILCTCVAVNAMFDEEFSIMLVAFNQYGWIIIFSIICFIIFQLLDHILIKKPLIVSKKQFV